MIIDKIKIKFTVTSCDYDVFYFQGKVFLEVNLEYSLFHGNDCLLTNDTLKIYKQINPETGEIME